MSAKKYQKGPINWFRKQPITIRGTIIAGIFSLLAAIPSTVELFAPDPPVIVVVPATDTPILPHSPDPLESTDTSTPTITLPSATVQVTGVAGASPLPQSTLTTAPSPSVVSTPVSQPTHTVAPTGGESVTPGPVITGSLITGTTTRVSVASDGSQGNGPSSGPSISADGRYVVFTSKSTNLLGGVLNGFAHVFVHDRQTGETTLVSMASDGTLGYGSSEGGVSISADGRYVAFASYADNLVGEDTTHASSSIFVHDRQTRQTTLVSIATDGTPADGSSSHPSISADGRLVAFQSGSGEIFVHDRDADRNDVFDEPGAISTTCVSVASDGTPGDSWSTFPVISADGWYVAFSSNATNLVSGDTNEKRDIFIHDRHNGQISRVSVNSDGMQLDFDSDNPSISADGRFVAFDSGGGIYLSDRQTEQIALVSVTSFGAPANLRSEYPTLSADGRFVAFMSYAVNLVSGDTNNRWDFFVHDLQTGQNSRVSVASDGTQGDGDPGIKESLLAFPSLSADGRFVAFESGSTNLVIGDTNQTTDVFVHDRGEPIP